MNDEELAAIEQRIAEPKPLRTGDMLDLIAEVRRLQGEVKFVAGGSYIHRESMAERSIADERGPERCLEGEKMTPEEHGQMIYEQRQAKRIADLEEELERVNKDRQELFDLTVEQHKDNNALCSELAALKATIAVQTEIKMELLERISKGNRLVESKDVELESREDTIRDLQLEKSHLWADKQFLEAQCAALREVLSSAAYYYEPATTILAQLDAGAALLKRLQAAEAVCETLANYEYPEQNIDTDTGEQEIYSKVLDALQAWRKAKGE